jgi:hypothetical protein
MRLDSGEVQAAYYAVSGFIRERCVGGRAVPGEVERLFRRLDHTVRMSRARHESGCTADDAPPSDVDAWIGTRDVAQMLGWKVRRVQRHALQLGGQMSSGRLLFRESAVIEYSEGIADG